MRSLSTVNEHMTENRWVWQCKRVIPSKTRAGARVLQEVLDELEKRDWIQHDIFSIHLAMEEALANAIRHGNRLDPSKHVRIACRMCRDLVQIEITDEGKGFDPSVTPDPTDPSHLDALSERGVLVMRSFMSRVAYNDVGNSVMMEKQRAKKDDQNKE
jgi:serine/threonine-protein kinase RsbW